MWSFAPRRVSQTAGALPDFTQRQTGNEHFVGFARGHESIDEDLSRRRYGDVIDRIAQRAFQHHGPEPPHGTLRLPLAAEPLAHGGRVGRVRVVMAGQSQHGSADGAAFTACQVAQPPQPWHQVQWRRQPAIGGKVVTGAVGAEKMQRRIAIEAVGRFRASAKIQQVRTATHRHVRRKINELTDADVVIRTGPAARRGACSNNSTWNPRSTPATAAASPARPPPTIASEGGGEAEE